MPGVHPPRLFRWGIRAVGWASSKIPYLKDLECAAIELLPVADFDHRDNPRQPAHQRPLINYWGYDPLAFSRRRPVLVDGDP